MIATRHRHGFTLIELLVVVSVVVLLSGMAASLVTVSKRFGKKANTEIVMRQVGTALRLFQRDNGMLPYQRSYPDAVTRTTPFANGLARRLGTEMSASDANLLNQALTAAAGKYAYWGNLVDAGGGSTEGNTPAGTSFDNTLTYRESYLLSKDEVQRPGDGRNAKHAYAMILNRAAADRARMAVFAGAVDLPGPYIVSPVGNGPAGGVPLDLSATPLLTAMEHDASVVGWCGDYLEGALSPRDVIGDDIVDAWRRPLIYVCQVIPKSRSTSAAVRNLTIKSQDLSWYGLGTTGFKGGTGPWSAIIAKQRWRLLANGRVTVGALCVDGLLADAPGKEVLAVPMEDSDRRYFAGAGFENDFELWSAGNDAAFAWSRSDPVNTDNIPLFDYDRGLR